MSKIKLCTLSNTLVISNFHEKKVSGNVNPVLKKSIQEENEKTLLVDCSKDFRLETIIGGYDLPDAPLQELDMDLEGYSISDKQARRIKKMITFLHKDVAPKAKIKMWTITTCQHKNDMLDKEITSVLSKMFDNYIKQGFLSNRYIWVSERQKNGDIHFHIVVEQLKPVHFPNVIDYLNERLQGTGTNVFHISKEKKKSVKYLKDYLTKETRALVDYVTKELKSPVKTRFNSRPSQISHSLLKSYSMKANEYEVGIMYDDLTYEETEYLCAFIDGCKVLSFDFCFVYILKETQTITLFEFLTKVKREINQEIQI